MFTEGGDEEESGIELAGQQVTGKLSKLTRNHPVEILMLISVVISVRRRILLVWRDPSLLVSLSTQTAGRNCWNHKELQNPRPNAGERRKRRLRAGQAGCEWCCG